MSLVLSVGVDFAANEPGSSEKPRTRLPKLHDVLRYCGRREEWVEVSPTSGYTEIENKQFEHFDDFIHRLSKYCVDYNRSRPDEADACFFVAVCLKDDGGAAPRAEKLLGGMMDENHDTRANLPVATVITDKVYQQIRPKFQESYHSSREIRGITVHERFRENMARCFVISPIGPEGSPARQRADEVFTHYIQPACETTEYQAVRGDMMSGDRITPEIEEALRISPMVIAYLGSPPWNPNVMYETGARKLLGLPLVVLKDEKTADGEPTELPFDLKDERVVDLSVPLDLDLQVIGPKIRTIRQHIVDRERTIGGPMTIYPSAVVEFPIGHSEQSKFTEVSETLEELFEMANMRERPLYDVIRHLETKMTPSQYNAFVEEQRRIINDLLSGDPFSNLKFGSNRCASASASVPIVFSDHKILKGHAFLPVIVSHTRVKPIDSSRLNVVYIEVTAATHWDDGGKHYKCPLVNSNILDLNPGGESAH